MSMAMFNRLPSGKWEEFETLVPIISPDTDYDRWF